MTVNPYSYLVVPFAIHKDGITKFRELTDKYVAIRNSSIYEEQSTWIPGRVIKRRYKGQLYRDNMVYPHFSRIFEAFACNDKSGLRMPENDYYVFALNRYGEEEFFDQPLIIDYVIGRVEFSILNNKNSFDSIKMVLSINSSVGLLTIPVSARISYDDYKQFIYAIRKISSPSITKKNTNETPWSILEQMEQWMGEFNGCYHFFSEETLHLTYLVQEGDQIDDNLRQKLLDMVKGQNVQTMTKETKPNLIEIPNLLAITSSLEGVSILTMSDRSILDNDRFKEYYGTEQTERYIITMSVIMQRYALIRMIDDLTELGVDIRREDESKRNRKKDFLKILREQVKSVSLIRIKNYFSEVSSQTLYNEFYQMCCSSFGINNLYQEIEQKMSMLNTYLTQQSDERHEKAELQLSIIAAVLTVTSATSDVSQLSKGIIGQPWLFILGMSFAIVVFAFIYKTILKNMR